MAQRKTSGILHVKGTEAIASFTVTQSYSYTVEKAVDLAAMDKNGKSDPYAVITSTFNKQRFKTKVCKKTLNPMWNETFDLYVDLSSTFTYLSYVSQPTGEVHIRLWDKDRWSKDDFLGEVILPVSSLADGQAVDKFYTVQNEPKSGKLKGQPAGQIKVTLHFPSGKVSLSLLNELLHHSRPSVHLKLLLLNRLLLQQSPKPSKKLMRLETSSESASIHCSSMLTINRGGFSIVKKARKKDTGVNYAIKIISKGDKKKEELQLLQREIDIMHKLASPNIITLEEVYETDDTIYLVLELYVEATMVL